MTNQPALSAKVGVVMGSQSDWPIMRLATAVLSDLKISFEVRIVSAHRTPHRLYRYATQARERGLLVLIAGAGGAAHLPGMLASLTTLPVCGVPIPATTLQGVDSLYSIAQMPAGIPVATLAIGEAGARNAGWLAGSILSLSDERLAKSLALTRQSMMENVPQTPLDTSSLNINAHSEPES